MIHPTTPLYPAVRIKVIGGFITNENTVQDPTRNESKYLQYFLLLRKWMKDYAVQIFLKNLNQVLAF